MDPRSGELYRLRAEEAAAGDVLRAKDARAADMETREKLKALMEEEGGPDRPLVMVDEQVVQKLRLGEKELRRRRQRRR